SVTGGLLTLRGCRLRHAGSGPALVVRNGAGLDMERCTLDADQIGVSVEVGAGSPCRVRVRDSTMRVREPGGAAVSLCAEESSPAGEATLTLRGSTWHAGRVVALRSLSAPVTVQAEGNRFHFRRALLSLTGYPQPEGWRQALLWRGEDNLRAGEGPWLEV